MKTLPSDRPAIGDSNTREATGKGQGQTGITSNPTPIQQRDHADELRAGWSAALDALKRHLECA